MTAVKRIMHPTLVPCVLLWLAVPLAAAGLTPAPLFRDGAVLQRDREIPVWGLAAPAAKVSVSFAGNEVTATTAADGRWHVKLPATAANAEPRVMTISSGETSVEINDILVGEVWLASGQSNMGWRINQSRKEDRELATQAAVPGLRVFTVPQRLNHVPQFAADGGWQHATPQNAPQLTAVGYFFGRRLVEDLGIPVGIIHSSWGGSRIEPWLDEVSLEGIPELEELRNKRRPRDPMSREYRGQMRAYALQMADWSEQTVAAIDAGGDVPPTPVAPPVLSLGHAGETGTYQAMIHPLAPYAIRGFIWYQGESNRTDGMVYAAKKRALIQGWRSRFQVPEAPFLFVQIAPFQYGKDQPEVLAQFWVVQQESLKIPNTGMVVTNDIGNVEDIHPGNKSEVGRRLALWALADTYGREGVVKSGPLYRSHRVGEGAIVIEFDHIGGGLTTRDGGAPNHFEVAGEDGEFKPATAEISRDESHITLRSTEVGTPTQARFAWSKTAEPNLMNRAGLPAAAFHTRWP